MLELSVFSNMLAYIGITMILLSIWIMFVGRNIDDFFTLAPHPLEDQGAISFKRTWNDSRTLWKVLLPCLSTVTIFNESKNTT